MGFYNAIRSARRFARREAERRRIALGRFKLIPDTDESSIGPEWRAYEVRNGRASAVVWHPIGEQAECEARQGSGWVREFGGHVFAISIFCKE